MKKFVVLALVVVFTLSMVTSSFAGGDKNRGDKGKGSVVQNQVRK